MMKPIRTRFNKSFTRSYIGIDNGVTGAIGVIAFTKHERTTFMIPTPVFMEQDYTKKKQNVSRVDFHKMHQFLSNFSNAHVMMERPLVNPTKYKATLSAIRCMEATLIILESLNLGRVFVDSRKWQSTLLPAGTKTPPALKKASREIGSRLFPELKDKIIKQEDADAILIAEYCRKEFS